MCWLDDTKKQIDLRARYSTVKIYIVVFFYLGLDFELLGWQDRDLESFLLAFLYTLVIISVFSKTQYEKTNIEDEIIYFIFLKDVFLSVLTNVIIYLIFFSAGIFHVFRKILYFCFCIIKFTFTIWRPIFKKFGYLINFFKKKN